VVATRNGPGFLADIVGMKKQGWAVQVRRGFWVEENGPTVTEYAVLLVLIVFSVFAALTLIGAFLKITFTTVSNGIPGS
jgi:Flp pilus assembly pilin Flp